ncbi:MAG: pseudouridine synthase [Bacteroidales bacterium]|nr:pseudouridine synthase [Bacteroidales bacterium]
MKGNYKDRSDAPDRYERSSEARPRRAGARNSGYDHNRSNSSNRSSDFRKPGPRYGAKGGEERGRFDHTTRRRSSGDRFSDNETFSKRGTGGRYERHENEGRAPYGSGRPSRPGYRGKDTQYGRSGGSAYGSNRQRPAGEGGRGQRRPATRGRGANNSFREADPNVSPEKFLNTDKNAVRLNKYISNSGVCSRREADTYIAAGLVTVNGEVVTELGVKVTPADDVRFNGERLKGEQKVYIVMNKPKGYVTTVSDPHADKTVMELISKEKCAQRVFPVGRLDKSTTGVLLFTNDGHMAEKLMHPSYEIKKIYHVSLDKNLKGNDFEAILSGLRLEDGEIHADALSYVNEDNTQVGIEIHSGRNRIVRRIFEHLGYKVKKLDRVYFAGLTKKNLKRGQWRFLTEQEVSFLMMGSGC